jgi:hypothetical protein
MFLLFVHPAYAGRGVGRILLAAAHDALRAAGCREAFLFVHVHNERALAVYAAAGYRPDGSDRISDFRGTQVRELRFVKRLQISDSLRVSDRRRSTIARWLCWWTSCARHGPPCGRDHRFKAAELAGDDDPSAAGALAASRLMTSCHETATSLRGPLQDYIGPPRPSLDLP